MEEDMTKEMRTQLIKRVNLPLYVCIKIKITGTVFYAIGLDHSL